MKLTMQKLINNIIVIDRHIINVSFQANYLQIKKRYYIIIIHIKITTSFRNNNYLINICQNRLAKNLFLSSQLVNNDFIITYTFFDVTPSFNLLIPDFLNLFLNLSAISLDLNQQIIYEQYVEITKEIIVLYILIINIIKNSFFKYFFY